MDKIQTASKVVVVSVATGALAYGFWLSTKQRHHLTEVGDAKGIPFENRTYEQMKKHLPNNEIYSKVENHPFIPADFPPGRYTDDTQLSLAIAEALMESNGFDMEKIAQLHVKAYNETTVGWGGTRDAVKRLADKTHNFTNCGNEGAVGNGVIMKMAPLAYYYSKQSARDYPDHKKFMEIEQFARLSHDNPMSVVAACFHCKMLERFFRRAREGPNVFDSLQSRISFLDDAILCSVEQVGNLPPFSFQEMRYSSSDREEVHKKGDLLSQRLSLLRESAIKPGGLTDIKLVEISKGGTYYVINSITMVYGLFVQMNPSFEVIKKACFIGGDTDSNASIIGGMVGALKGPKVIPRAYVDGLEQSDKIVGMAKKFASLFLE